MKKFLQKKLKEQKGMTLIELLAVIVIIAIIAAIAIPAIGNVIENSRYGAAKSDFQNALAAANIYVADESKDPTKVGDLIPAHLEDAGTVDTDATFGRDADKLLTIAGDFKIGSDTFTLPATNNKTLSSYTTKEFKDLVTTP